MKLSKKMVLPLKVILIVCILSITIEINASANQVPNYDYRKIANFAIIFSNLDNPNQMQYSESLKSVELQNKNNVKMTFYNNKNNIRIQSVNIDLVTNSDFDLIIASLVETTENSVKDFIVKAKNKNIPLVLINVDPKVIANVSKYYNKVIFISLSLSESGIAQGKMIANIWNSYKNKMDKNGDGILQYILLKGLYLNEIAEERSRFSLSTIRNSGITTEELQLIYCNWSREVAKNAIENMLLKYNGSIEAIIANNDNMAIGAIEGLQKYGYNTGNKTKYIPVFGIDGIPEALNLIDKGFMTGTVIMDTKEASEGLYIIGMNLINNLNPINNTNYKIENNQIYVVINLKPYVNNNFLNKNYI